MRCSFYWQLRSFIVNQIKSIAVEADIADRRAFLYLFVYYKRQSYDTTIVPNKNTHLGRWGRHRHQWPHPIWELLVDKGYVLTQARWSTRLLQYIPTLKWRESHGFKLNAYSYRKICSLWYIRILYLSIVLQYSKFRPMADYLLLPTIAKDSIVLEPGPFAT